MVSTSSGGGGRRSCKKVLKEWAAQLTRERDSVTDRTEKREAERARKVAEAAAVLIRFFDGCTDFPDLQQASLEAVGYMLDAKKDGAPIPPHSTDLIFPLLALTFRRLS
mmetsp:Transcript_2264/g.4762  ORF Transcript_2264/g.4762 Transcript_2264/m.4762 type:complete len:109 (+) Transcript_2264:848-1174(+)